MTCPRASFVVLLLSAAGALMGCSELDPTDSGASAPADDLEVFATAPDVAGCVPGALTPEYQQRIVRRVNQLRLLHELPPVAIRTAEQAPAQAAALVAVANATLSHGLLPSAFCYTSEAARSSAESLLFLSAGNQVGNVRDPDRFLADWLRDADIANLGHRRWLLDPFVNEVAFGFVQGEPLVPFPYKPVVGAVLHVVDESAEVDLTYWPSEMVAYPYGVYPSELFDKSWLSSFSVVADRSQRLGSVDRVSFASAKVVVSDATGAVLSVRDVSGAYDLTGLPNVLTWRTDGLSDGVAYKVKIENVEVDQASRDFEYGFTLVP